ncbi:MAG: hypothetical protein IJ306_09305 [Oscillospiraceae bacterium]|nr:hypothetical protein [Oscillospiraceae bacterium]
MIKGLFYLACGIGAIVLGVYIFEDDGDYSWPLIIMGALLILGSFAPIGEAIKKFDKKMGVSVFNDKVKRGEWEFPCELFYNKCKRAHVVSFNDEFSIKKAQQIMTKILEENKVDEKYYSIYLEPKKMQELYENGPKQTKERLKHEQEEKNKEILKQKEIKEFRPNKEVREYAELALLKGTKKREKMLYFEYEEKREEWKELYEEKEKFRKHIDYLRWKSEHNDADWAIAGGIAEGIAGPAAGVAVAMDTMAQNAKNAEDNQNMRDFATTLDYLSLNNLEPRFRKVDGELDKIKEEQENAKNKVVLSKPNGKEIAKYLSVEKTDFDRMDDGVLEISAKLVLKESIKLDVPKGTKMVVDGVISGKVFYEGKFVDDVKLVLPTYGITNISKRIAFATGYCTKSAEYKGNYTLEITDMTNLWVMEY